MVHPTPLYIVASPRQRVGKTLLARLLIDFFRTSQRPLEGYDLDPHEPALAERFPDLVRPIDIGDTNGQIQLFDRLLAHDSTTKVIDLGCGPFEQFFAVMREIGFVAQAQQYPCTVGCCKAAVPYRRAKPRRIQDLVGPRQAQLELRRLSTGPKPSFNLKSSGSVSRRHFASPAR